MVNIYHPLACRGIQETTLLFEEQNKVVTYKIHGAWARHSLFILLTDFVIIVSNLSIIWNKGSSDSVIILANLSTVWDKGSSDDYVISLWSYVCNCIVPFVVSSMLLYKQHKPISKNKNYQFFI